MKQKYHENIYEMMPKTESPSEKYSKSELNSNDLSTIREIKEIQKEQRDTKYQKEACWME